MAKPTIMKIALIIALTMAAGTAYASDASITKVVSVGASSFTPSNNVQLNVSSDGTAYAANSSHAKGNRIIGFNSKDSKLYYSSQVDVIGTYTSAPGVTGYDNISTTSGWNSM